MVMPRKEVEGYLEDAIKYVRDCCDAGKRPSVGGFAQLLGIDRTTANRRFKRAHGITLSGFFSSFRHSSARDQLEKSQLKVSSVAWECGYQSPRDLERSFARLEGVSPAAYRKRLKTSHKKVSSDIDAE